MKISGFTFVRNAFVFSYPLQESLESLLPLVDELVIAVGEGDDETFEFLINWNHPKIKLIPTQWDPKVQKDGWIYAEQTNIALRACTGDWCIYLQADEVLEESDYQKILDNIRLADKNPNVDALLFRYKHFYGSYDYIGTGRQWYRREIRAIRNKENIVSWGDAQGFRIKDNDNISKLKAIQTDAYIYHYGWVRPPKAQHLKITNAENYYHASNQKLEEIEVKEFDYNTAYSIEKYTGLHPRIMKSKIAIDSSWTKDFDPKKLKTKPLRMKISDWIEKHTGIRIGEFKDFIEVK